MARHRQRPTQQEEGRAHEAKESAGFERGEKEDAREAAAKHLSEDAREGKEHAKKDAALARRLKKRGK